MTFLRCRACGATVASYAPACPDCGERGGLAVVTGLARSESGPLAVPLADVPLVAAPRWPTGVAALDQVLGGGCVAGAVTLIGGRRGLGKSTLLLQACSGLARSLAAPVLYVACEEDAPRIRARAAHVGADPDAVRLLIQPTLETVEAEAARGGLGAVAVDPIHRLHAASLGRLGPRRHLSACVERLVALARARDLIVLLLAHMSRRNEIAGPMTIEHAVDAVVYLDGSVDSPLRRLRAEKNRDGATDAVGRLEMTARGLV